MFRFFRKHRWILIIAMTITAGTFVFFMGQGGSRNVGANSGDYGKIYGRKVTQQDYADARNEFFLFYFFRNGEWPDNASFTTEQVDQEIYVNLMLDWKAQDLGIQVGENELAASAANLLHSLDRNGQHITLDILNKEVLQPRGMTVDDFERLARRDIIVRQLIEVLGLSGSLVTPQEAQDLYQREHQEISAQAVFFSASNYLADVTATPAAIAQFYTNYMAEYRLPDRVQVSYVEFNLSNYLADAEEKIGVTNLNNQVDEIFRERGMDAVPGAKTPEEAKAKIREALLHQQAALQARQAATDFATTLFNEAPMNAASLTALAKKENLTVVTPKPFGEEFGPEETPMPAAFVRAAFALNAEQPISEPIGGPSGFFVIALDKTLPSEIPSLESIRDRVINDYKMAMATQLAHREGTNFVQQLDSQMATGKSFAVASVAAGFAPETLPAFSLNTTDLPELGNRVDLQQLKQVALTTPVGRPSSFEETSDGGFVLFVEKKLPMNTGEMAAQLPEFETQLRETREAEAFQAWIEAEANREFKNVPAFQKQAAAVGAR
jgi:parvulin-like peptidyl-prolyl isomerase